MLLLLMELEGIFRELHGGLMFVEKGHTSLISKMKAEASIVLCLVNEMFRNIGIIWVAMRKVMKRKDSS